MQAKASGRSYAEQIIDQLPCNGGYSSSRPVRVTILAEKWGWRWRWGSEDAEDGFWYEFLVGDLHVLLKHIAVVKVKQCKQLNVIFNVNV